MSKVKNVTIYSATWCPYCKMEEEWLKDKKVTHKVVLIDEDQAASMYISQKTGQMGVPVTEVTLEDDKKEYIIGFDRAKLTATLGL